MNKLIASLLILQYVELVVLMFFLFELSEELKQGEKIRWLKNYLKNTGVLE